MQGKTWSEVAYPQYVTGLYNLTAVPDGSLWLATREGALRSTDGGKTWEHMSWVACRRVMSSPCATIPASQRLLATALYAHGVFESKDGGQSWQRTPDTGVSIRAAMELPGTNCWRLRLTTDCCCNRAAVRPRRRPHTLRKEAPRPTVSNSETNRPNEKGERWLPLFCWGSTPSRLWVPAVFPIRHLIDARFPSSESTETLIQQASPNNRFRTLSQIETWTWCIAF